MSGSWTGLVMVSLFNMELTGKDSLFWNDSVGFEKMPRFAACVATAKTFGIERPPGFCPRC